MENIQEFLVTKTINLRADSVESKRAQILDYFKKTYALYESLFDCLKSDESYYQRANPLRHPLIFYYAHTAVFYINKLSLLNYIDSGIDKKIETMMAVGVDEMSWDDLNEANYDWPSVQDVFEYRMKAKKIIEEFISDTDFTLPIDKESPMWIIMMGIEHERIHLETSSVLIRELPLHLVKKVSPWSKICHETDFPKPNECLLFKGEEITLGLEKNYPMYYWDCEGGQEVIKNQDFKVSKFLVSNNEFKDFVNDDGYQTLDFWCEEGKAWLNYSKATQPVFWIKHQNQYQLRTMLEVIPMPWDWPAEVNYLEAKAFCNWRTLKSKKNTRLLIESEWMQLRSKLPSNQNDWDQAPGNINLEYFMSSTPVDYFEPINGIYDVIGNVWQWTESYVDGFKGFQTHKAYDDFSTPTFDGLHNCIKGGSWISTGNLALKNARYAFRRHFFQHAGFRYVEADHFENKAISKYETDFMISRSIEKDYSSHCHELKKTFKNIFNAKKEKALHLGSESGRVAFELSSYFHSVDALEQSAKYLIAPIELQEKGITRYLTPKDGDLVYYNEIQSHTFDFQDRFKNVNFEQCDLLNLKEKYIDYDLIFISHLVKKVESIDKLIEIASKKLKSNANLMILTDYQFKDINYLGRKDNRGENLTALDILKEKLSAHFTFENIFTEIEFKENISSRETLVSKKDLIIWKKK